MAIFKIRTLAGDLVTVEDGRDLTTLCETLREKGFLQVQRRDSHYSPSLMTLVSFMAQAVISIELAAGEDAQFAGSTSPNISLPGTYNGRRY